VKDTFTVDSVVAEMKGILCFNVDAHSEAGRPLATRFRVRGLPTLLFLEPDSSVRDGIFKYLPAEGFLKEVARIKRNEGTLSSLRARVRTEPADLESRYDLAKKLCDMGDEAGAAEQLHAIRTLDPEGNSSVAHLIRLDEIEAAFDRREPDLTPLYAFLEQESHSRALYEGWKIAWRFEARLASDKKRPERAVQHVPPLLVAGKQLWSKAQSHLAGADLARLANEIAWGFWLRSASLTEADRVFALDVAARAVELLPQDAYLVDTYACCLFLNGRKDEALAQVQRCIELQPDSAEWKKRLEQFTGSAQ
jgi:predicted Zn-dependent protease